MARTDVRLQSLSLAKAKELLSQGWSLNQQRTTDGLEVWLTHKDRPAVYEHCDPRDFVELATFARECQQAARIANPPITHALVLKSQNVYSYGYNEATRVLEVRFRKADGGKGSLYRHFEVDAETVSQFETHPSKGGGYNLFIKGKFQYEKVNETVAS